MPRLAIVTGPDPVAIPPAGVTAEAGPTAARLLVLSSGSSDPADGGLATALCGFVDAAIAALGAGNVAVVSILPARAEPAAAAGHVVHLRPAPVFLRALLVALWSLVLRRRSAEEMSLAAPAAARRIAAILAELDPDVVLVEGIAMAQHLPMAARRHRRCVLYLDGLYSLRWRRTLQALDQLPEMAIGSLGALERLLPGILCRLLRRPSFQRRLLALESRLLARREAAMPRLFDHVVLTSAAEAAELAAIADAENVAAVVPLLREAPAVTRRFAGTPLFLFRGDLRDPANICGLALFLQRALPGFVACVPEGRIVVVGDGAGCEIRQLARRFGEQVSFFERLADLEALYAEAAGMIAPSVFGAGARIEIVEALGRGVPLVSTNCAIDGLGLTPGVHCFVDDDVGRFPAMMARLLDPRTNAAMSRAAAAYFAQSLTPAAAAAGYRRLLFDGLPVGLAPPG